MVQLQVKTNTVQTSNLKNVARRKYTSLTHSVTGITVFSLSSFFQLVIWGICPYNDI